MWGRENVGGVFLGIVPNQTILITASYVMGKCRSGVFESVFCSARESMELLRNEECPRGNAVSLYFLEKPHFTLVKE